MNQVMQLFLFRILNSLSKLAIKAGMKINYQSYGLFGDFVYVLLVVCYLKETESSL